MVWEGSDPGRCQQMMARAVDLALCLVLCGLQTKNGVYIFK